MPSRTTGWSRSCSSRAQDRDGPADACRNITAIHSVRVGVSVTSGRWRRARHLRLPSMLTPRRHLRSRVVQILAADNQIDTLFFALIKSLCVGGLLQTDPQERAVSLRLSASLSPSPSLPPSPSLSRSLQTTLRHRRALATTSPTVRRGGRGSY